MECVMVIGATGFVGRHVVRELLLRGHEVVVVSRNREQASSVFGKHVYVMAYDAFVTAQVAPKDITVIVNLAGESLNASRWTRKRKIRIMQSRLATTEALSHFIAAQKTKPRVLIQASAVGYYGVSTTATFTEDSASVGNDFLASVAKAWEERTQAVQSQGVRVVLARFGVVLGADGGALEKMMLPYRLHVGGKIGSGTQFVSWIHMDDVIGMIMWSMSVEDVFGPVNMTALEPVTMDRFGQVLAHEMKRKHWASVPSIVLRLFMGEMADMVLLGQRVLPDKAIKHGYTFLFPDLQSALSQLIHPNSK
ncbi:TIGR01777 family oxidoreductase [Sulfoacidibacillus ferrooxidans]